MLLLDRLVVLGIVPVLDEDEAWSPFAGALLVAAEDPWGAGRPPSWAGDILEPVQGDPPLSFLIRSSGQTKLLFYRDFVVSSSMQWPSQSASYFAS